MNNLKMFNKSIQLNENEYKKFEDFRLKHKKPVKLIIDWSSGIGINFTVKSEEDELDITDYETW